MYFKNNSFYSEKFYLRWFMLILAGLILCNIGCQKTTEPQIRNIAVETVKEEADMGNPDNAKEDFTDPNNLDFAIWEKKNPPRITIEATTYPQKKVLTLTYSVKNTTGEPICLFHYDPPFICLAPQQRVAFMSMIPVIPSGIYTRQYYPPVVRLEKDEIMTGKASYALPLSDTHPYGGSVDMFFPMKEGTGGGTDPKMRIKDKINVEEMIRRSRSLIKEDVSQDARMYIGYFPEKDLKKGFRPGEKNLDFKHQLLAKSRIISLSVPVRLPPSVVRLKTYWRK